MSAPIPTSELASRVAGHSFAPVTGSASRSKFKTIVADPPWDYAGKTPPWRSTSEQTYKLMSLDEICALPVGDLATGDAHLYLWAVLPMMSEAYEVVEAWDSRRKRC